MKGREYLLTKYIMMKKIWIGSFIGALALSLVTFGLAKAANEPATNGTPNKAVSGCSRGESCGCGMKSGSGDCGQQKKFVDANNNGICDRKE